MNASTSATQQNLLAEVNDGPQLNITVWTLTGVAAAFLGLRIYAKLWRHRRLRWDDYILAAGWVALIVSCSFMSVCVHYGLGRHGDFIKPENLDNLLFFSYVAGFFAILAAAWTKSSFAITLLSISEGRVRQIVLFILVSINIVFCITGTLQWVQCWPPERAWHPGGKGKCWLGSGRSQAVNTFVAAYSGCADIILALLPWKIIWHAKIRQTEKLGALFVMSMGVFAGITSMLKITQIDAIGNTDLITTVNLFIFAIAEGAITIMAASMPILRALLTSNS